MFKDDQMISVLTGVVLMVVIGTMIHSADGFSFLSDPEPEPVALTDDVAMARVDSLLRIDVLDNDTGLGQDARRTLSVVEAPGCGQVFVQGEALQYLPGSDCGGTQIIRYAARVGDETLTASVTVSVLSRNETQPGDPVPAKQPVVAAAPTSEPAETGAAPEPAAAPDMVVATSPQPVTTPDVDVQSLPPEPRPKPQWMTELSAAGQAETGADGAIGVVAVLDDTEPQVAIAPQVPTTPDVVEQAPVAHAGLSAPASLARSGLVEMKTSLVPAPAQGRSPRIAEAPPPLIDDTPPEIAGSAPEIASPSAIASLDPQLAEPEGRTDSVGFQWSSLFPIGEERLDFSKVVIERAEPDTLPPAPPVHGVPSSAPNLGLGGGSLPRVDAAPEVEISMIQPDAALDAGTDVQALTIVPPTTQQSLTLPPVDTRTLPDLPAPRANAPADTESTRTSAAPRIQSRQPARPARPAPAEAAPAALSSPTEPCVTAPAMTLDIRRGAITVISVVAPCHGNTLAVLSYADINFAITLDAEGQGEITALGLADNMPALISFENGDEIDFDLPFRGIDRVTRVAIVWTSPIKIGLNALEFGAGENSTGHVHAGNPRDFSSARRARGGFMNSYRPVGGVGDNVQFYTFWHQSSGGTGVVKLMVDYPDQPEHVATTVCGGASLQPEITVLRTERGLPHRSVLRKLPPIDCSTITRENQHNRLISGAVDDLVIMQR